jgi:hypothetical protein
MRRIERVNGYKDQCGIGEHPSGPSAVFEDEFRELCGIGEHPSECNAERVTFISPRGEMGQVRSALGPEGCPAIPPPSTERKYCLETTQTLQIDNQFFKNHSKHRALTSIHSPIYHLLIYIHSHNP